MCAGPSVGRRRQTEAEMHNGRQDGGTCLHLSTALVEWTVLIMLQRACIYSAVMQRLGLCVGCC